MRRLAGVGVAIGVVVLILGYGYWSLVYVDEANLLTFGSPEGIKCFAVLDSRGATVWVIQAASPQKIEAIRYGQVPSGFVQAFPSPEGKPRQLVRGELITLRAEAITRYQEHQCTVTDVESASCGTYVQGPVPDSLPGQANSRACCRTRG